MLYKVILTFDYDFMNSNESYYQYFEVTIT